MPSAANWLQSWPATVRAAVLPAAAVHDLVEWPPPGFLDGHQRAVSRVAERDQQSPVAVLGEAEQFAGQLDVGDARVAAADAQVGGRQRHGHRRLAQVELGSVTRMKSHGCQFCDDGDRRPASRIWSRWAAGIGWLIKDRTFRREVMASHVCMTVSTHPAPYLFSAAAEGGHPPAEYRPDRGGAGFSAVAAGRDRGTAARAGRTGRP